MLVDVPLVPAVLVELPLEAGLLPSCAFVRIQPELLELPLGVVPLVVPAVVPEPVVPDVPAVPVIEPELPARCRHPVTVTVLPVELLDD